ncbi:MAG: alpha-amylase family glycosyl hydrolase [Candidatus Hodarchaeota archaeon]
MSKFNVKWPKNPRILEINTWPWLHSLSEIHGHEIKLDNIPVQLIDQELAFFDAIWLMGIWERSPKGRDIAINHEGLQEEYRKALRYFNTEDVIGSPYSIYYYHVDSHYGRAEALESFRKDLAERDLLLILDYVPNHVSIDHLWTLEKSDVFIKGTIQDQMTKPYEFFSVGNIVYAHGRDPNFPPWTDTVQINAFSKEAREKAINTLLSIAKQCDGVRCDMAMLMLNEIFVRNWGEKAGSVPEKDFWEEVIPAVKEKYPDFIFIGEVYWDMEWKLMQQGFDYCYDKRLYERLANENAQNITEHLKGDLDFQKKLVRFIENHDEQRAVSVFGEEASKAAAMIALTLPGARLIYEGQLHGYEIKLPVQLGRSPTEEGNIDIMDFYNNFLEIWPGREFSEAKWALCEVKSVSPDDSSFKNIISYHWHTANQDLLIVVNYSLNSSKAHVKVKGLEYGLSNWNFSDKLNKKEYTYKGKDLDENGLYVALDAWKGHIFEIKKQ